MRLERGWNAVFLLVVYLALFSILEPVEAASAHKQREAERRGLQQNISSSGYRYEPLLAPNPVVQEMIEQVNQEILLQYIGDLSGEWPVDIGGLPYTIETRNSFSGEPIQKSAGYLFEHYQSHGLQVTYQDFSLGDTPLQNVIAATPGSLSPEEISLIIAHYDSAPSGPLAPGADDNASGTAAVMLAAQILSQYDFGCTLRFANFSGEEQGLVGSKAAAQQSFCEGESLRAVLNLDMIGWNTPESPAKMDLHVDQNVPGSEDIALLYQDVIETYGLDLTPEIVFSGISASDHASYWMYDFPAILAIEDLADFNPHYHKTTDQLEHLDLEYLADIARASLATMAHLSCLVDSGWGTIYGKISDGQNGAPVPGAAISFYHPGWDLHILATSDDQGHYQRELPASAYIVSADALGFSMGQVGLVNVAPGDANSQDIELQPAPESANYLPLVQDTALNPACP